MGRLGRDVLDVSLRAQLHSSAELSASCGDGDDQELARGAAPMWEETAAGRKPRAIIQTAKTISCTAREMYNKLCAIVSVPMSPYIAST